METLSCWGHYQLDRGGGGLNEARLGLLGLDVPIWSPGYQHCWQLCVDRFPPSFSFSMFRMKIRSRLWVKWLVTIVNSKLYQGKYQQSMHTIKCRFYGRVEGKRKLVKWRHGSGIWISWNIGEYYFKSWKYNTLLHYPHWLNERTVPDTCYCDCELDLFLPPSGHWRQYIACVWVLVPSV